MILGSLLLLHINPFWFLCACLVLDILFGDPQYRFHPIRVMGRLLSSGEEFLRRNGQDGRLGGFLLFLWLFATAGGFAWGVHALLLMAWWPLAVIWKLYLGYSLMALGDLVAHGRRIAGYAAAGNIEGARTAAGMLVGRDTAPMDAPACNRAAVESVAENLVDGVIAPLFWFAVGGMPGLIVFKIASTMDSMVGYKNEKYLHFGWFGARLDDVMNWIPSRLTFALIALLGAVLPGYSGRKAWKIGLAQHAMLPGPNKGWSETAAAGALEIRLAGPIWAGGVMVNDKWIGDPADREGGTAKDVGRMIGLAYGVTALFMLIFLAARRLGLLDNPWR